MLRRLVRLFVRGDHGARNTPEEAFLLRISLVLIILLVFLLNAGGLYFYLTAFEQLNMEWGTRLRAIAMLSSEGIGQFIDEYGLAALGDEGLAELVKPWLEKVQKDTAVRRLVLLTAPTAAAAVRVGAESEQEEEILTEMDAAEIHSAWLGFASETKGFVYDGVNYKRAYAPVLTPNGTVAAVVGVEADASFFDTLERFQRSLFALAVFSMVICMGAVFIVRRMARSFVRLEEALARSERVLELDQLASSLAHEIRNPLGIVLANAEVLHDQIDDPSQREMLTDLVTEAERLDRMVEATLERMRTGKAAPERFSPLVIVQECAEQFRQSLTTPGVELVVDKDPSAESSLVEGEKARLEGAILNLLRNALEAMAQGGKIELSVKSSGDEVHIIVKDAGPGMSRWTLRHAFLPFYTEKRRGLGLGLPTVRRIVREMNGEVRIRSNSGKGTEVALILPKGIIKRVDYH